MEVLMTCVFLFLLNLASLIYLDKRIDRLHARVSDIVDRKYAAS